MDRKQLMLAFVMGGSLAVGAERAIDAVIGAERPHPTVHAADLRRPVYAGPTVTVTAYGTTPEGKDLGQAQSCRVADDVSQRQLDGCMRLLEKTCSWGEK